MTTPVSLLWGDEMAEWATALRAARRSQQTIDLRIYHLGRLARAYPGRSPWDLTLDDLLAWTGGHVWARETARSTRSSLRGFWRWGVATGRTLVAVADGLPVIPAQPPCPRPAPRGPVRDALAVADARATLLLRLSLDMGLRRGEVALAHTRDLREDLTGWSLHVHGKGSRDRVIPLPDDLARALRTLPAGWVFPGRIGGHLSPRWVGTLVRDAMGRQATMHQLRHLAASDIYARTHDLRLIQELLGHASLATTQRYVAVQDGAVRAAVADHSRAWHAA